MITDFTNFKKLSLAFALTCTVAAHVGNVQAGWKDYWNTPAVQPEETTATLAAGVEVGKDKLPGGGTEYYAKQKIDVSPVVKDTVKNVAGTVKETAKDVKAGTKQTLADLKKKAQEKKDATVEKGKEAVTPVKENVKAAGSSIGGFVNNVASSTWAAVKWPFVKTKELTSNTIGKVVEDHPFLAGLVTGVTVTAVVNHYLFHKRANYNFVKNISPEEAQNVIIAQAILDYDADQNKYDTLVGKIQAQGGPTIADEANLAALQSQVAMRYAALSALLRSQKTTLDIIKAALLPSSK